MILIKHKMRLLVLAAVGAALILGVAMIVSLKGDDKPAITNDPPAEDEPVDDAPVTPADEPYVPPTTDDEDDVADEPEEPVDDDTGPGDGDDDSPAEVKARGLARAAQVHMRNIEKLSDKGKSAPQGLTQSMEMLAEKYAALQAVELEDKDNNGKHKGWDQSGKA